jgi:DNA-binding IclR family transcriptional regulator
VETTTAEPADDWAEVCATIGICGKRRPVGQTAVIRALLGAMGAARGAQPDLRAIAVALGVTHQTLYRTMRTLEAKGVVVRREQRWLEIRLG